MKKTINKLLRALVLILSLILITAAFVACNSGDTGMDTTPATDTDVNTAPATEEGTTPDTDAPDSQPEETTAEEETTAVEEETTEAEEVTTEDIPEDIPEVMKDPEKAAKINELLNIKHELRVDENGNFKVLVLSDVQFNTPNINEETLNNIKTVVDREKPDLVIFNGDNSFGIQSEKVLKEYITNMTAYLEENHIPWAHVYGNHDAENHAARTSLSREKQQAIYESFPYCVSKAGEEDLYGVGNFVIPILEHDSDKIAFNVWCFDSGTTHKIWDSSFPDVYVGDNGFWSHYDTMEMNQVEWFKESSALLEAYNGGPIPGMMAFHIPLQESYYAWVARETENLEWDGHKRENISAHAQDVPLFAAAKENGILAIVNSHDHINDFMVKYQGVRLCYTACIGTLEYHADDLLGGRVVEFNTAKPGDVNTYMSYVNEIVVDDKGQILSDRLVLEKDTFAEGEPITVIAKGKGRDWIGIQTVEKYNEGYSSDYWWYIEAIGSGTEFNLVGSVDGTGRTVTLPAGEYIIRLLENDLEFRNESAIASMFFTVVASEDDTDNEKPGEGGEDVGGEEDKNYDDVELTNGETDYIKTDKAEYSKGEAIIIGIGDLSADRTHTDTRGAYIVLKGDNGLYRYWYCQTTSDKYPDGCGTGDTAGKLIFEGEKGNLLDALTAGILEPGTYTLGFGYFLADQGEIDYVTFTVLDEEYIPDEDEGEEEDKNYDDVELTNGETDYIRTDKAEYSKGEAIIIGIGDLSTDRTHTDTRGAYIVLKGDNGLYRYWYCQTTSDKYPDGCGTGDTAGKLIFEGEKGNLLDALTAGILEPGTYTLGFGYFLADQGEIDYVTFTVLDEENLPDEGEGGEDVGGEEDKNYDDVELTNGETDYIRTDKAEYSKGEAIIIGIGDLSADRTNTDARGVYIYLKHNGAGYGGKYWYCQTTGSKYPDGCGTGETAGKLIFEGQKGNLLEVLTAGTLEPGTYTLGLGYFLADQGEVDYVTFTIID